MAGRLHRPARHRAGSVPGPRREPQPAGPGERPYLTYNLAATRRVLAHRGGTDAVPARRRPLGREAARRRRARCATSASGTPRSCCRSYGQLQELRPYYSFTTVGVDRYQVNGVYTQTMLAPRELRRPGLPPQAQTWVNQHLTYTHGYGVALSAVNQIASGGTPDFLVQDVPTVWSAPTLAITQPRHALLRAPGHGLRAREDPGSGVRLPGSQGTSTRGTRGAGGSPSSSWLDRLAFTLRFADLRFLTTTSITAESRVIMYDELRARLAAAAPFLQFDRDPYMVIAGGRLFWVAHAYTTTRFIPVPHSQSGLNYIRNSVKVVVDAFNGSMAFYVFDSADPLLRTYERMFPGMFRPASANAGDAPEPRALPPGPLQRAVAALRDLSRHRSRPALQQGRPVGDPEQRLHLGVWSDERLLHDHAGLPARRARSSCSSCPSCPTTAPT